MSATPAQPVPDRLLAEFPEPAYADWRKLVEAELKGAPFEKKMLTVTPEGITLQPLYQANDIARHPRQRLRHRTLGRGPGDHRAQPGGV